MNLAPSLRAGAVLAALACAHPAAAASQGTDGMLRDLGKAAADSYVACRREARYAVDQHPQIPTGGTVPVAVLSRVKDCATRARYLVDKEMPALRAATTPYPRAAGYLRDWYDAYTHALDRLRADAESPRATEVSDSLREIVGLMARAVDEVHW